MRFARLHLALILALGSPSCIFLTSDGSEVQCESDADCGAVGDGLRCDTSQSVCVPVGDENVGGGTSTSSTSSTSSTGTGGEDVGCTSNEQCIDAQGQQPFLCDPDTRECVSLIVPGCTELIGEVEDLKAAEPLVLGVIAPNIPDEDVVTGLHTRAAVRLAVEEIQSGASGLPIGSDGQRRPLLFLACDELEDPVAAAQHLVEVVKVPAIYGALDPQVALDIANNVSVDGDTLLVTPGGSSLLTTLQDGGLVSVLRYEGRFAGEAVGHAVTAVELPLREQYALLEEDSLRVTTMVGTDTAGSEFNVGLFDTFSLNGMTLEDNITAGHAQTLGLPSDAGDDISAQVSSILDQLPHLIVVAGVPEVVVELIPQVEINWPTDEPYPQWLFDSTSDDERIAFAMSESEDTVGEGPIRPYLFMRPFLPPERDAYNTFSVRFRTRYNNEITAGTGEAPQAYDAAFALAYAATAAADSVPRLDGEAMASGLLRLDSGAPVQVGPDFLNQAFSPLKAGQEIQLVGTLGAFQLDEQGNQPAIFGLGCDTGGIGGVANFTPFYYDPNTGTVAPDDAFAQGGVCELDT